MSKLTNKGLGLLVSADLAAIGGIHQSNKRIGKEGREYDVSKIQEANKKRAKKTTTFETKTTK